MIAFLNILTVLYLISFIFVVYFFSGNKNKEVNDMLGVTKGDAYIVFFAFPFMAIGIFILELLNSISYLFTKKLFFQLDFFSRFKNSIDKKIEKEKTKRKERIEILKNELQKHSKQLQLLKKNNMLSNEQEKILEKNLQYIKNEIHKEEKIIEQL